MIKTQLGWKTDLNGHVNEIGEVGRVMTEEQCLLYQVSEIKPILNPITPLLSLNPSYSSHKYQKPIYHL